MRETVSLVVLLFTVVQTPTDRSAAAAIERHARAVGESSLRSIRARVTEGVFDNGRGLVVRFRTFEKPPNKRVTVLETDRIEASNGSGRGYDGTTGWDKNFIGTGLRTVTGPELLDLERESQFLAPLRLADGCVSLALDDGADPVVTCAMADGRTTRFHFDRISGLLAQLDVNTADGRGPRSAYYEDYRAVDGVRIPFRVRYGTTGSGVTYTSQRVRHNEAIDDRVFEKPKS